MSASHQALLMAGAKSGPPQLKAASNEEAANPVTSYSPTVPAHNVGDLIVVHARVQGGPGTGNFTINKGFTIGPQGNSGSLRNVGCAWKIADGDDNFTITPTTNSDVASRIEVFDTVYQTSPFEGTGITAGSNPASITPSWGAGNNTYFGCVNTTDNQSTSATFSSNYPDEQVLYQGPTGASDIGHQAYRSNTDTTSLAGNLSMPGTNPGSYRYAIRGLA